MYFVWDVEAIGLYGVGFSVGWVVFDTQGRELDEGYLACPLHEAEASPDIEDLAWVEQNVMPHLPDPNCDNLPDLYKRFWAHWTSWQDRGATMVADCNYPVETNFLRACVLNRPERKDTAPYPFLDVSSVLLAKGRDPVANYDRRESELPKHNPVCDARQSGRILVEVLHGDGNV